jgi:hypothetical protein
VQQENASALHGTMINLIAQQENASALHKTMIIFKSETGICVHCLWNNDIFDSAAGK